MADDLDIKDANAAPQKVRAREYASVKYPQIVDWTPLRLLSASGTNLTTVKNSAGTLSSIHVFNTNAALRYLKIYNKASNPTLASDVPIMTIPVPAGASRTLSWEGGLALSNGIAFAMTTGVADNDTGSMTAGDLTGVLAYK